MGRRANLFFQEATAGRRSKPATVAKLEFSPARSIWLRMIPADTVSGLLKNELLHLCQSILRHTALSLSRAKILYPLSSQVLRDQLSPCEKLADRTLPML
jgi:hypothetical protein